ncbi:kynureninase [Oleiharenicola lentus]|uniref:kynureninase n=1 Tax=Oleiharenicola lentus TaxID=2508720 RepID=UPI003F680F3A
MRSPAALDRADPLARFRAEFHLPPGKIYLDGNSLGLLSQRAETHLNRIVNEWRTLGIEGWTDANPPWVGLSESIAANLAPLVGALPAEVAVTGSTTGNLHQLLATFFTPDSPRNVILADELNFPSDIHALKSHLTQRGLDPAKHLRLVRSRDGLTLQIDDLAAAFTDDVQLAMFSAVQFKSGQLLDLAALTRAAHKRGVMIGFDCSHSIGAVPHELSNDGVDFAFWCSYKYLNAGPGAVGGIYLNQRHHARAPGLAGWWGVRRDQRFAMSLDHAPSPDASALQIGTPHLLSLAPLQGSLELFAEAGGIVPLRQKSLELTDYLMTLVESELTGFGFTLANPHLAHERGGHIALRHPEAWRICQALKIAGVVPDFRTPDLIRLAPAPLYTSFADCAAAIAKLREIMHAKTYEIFSETRAAVT